MISDTIQEFCRQYGLNGVLLNSEGKLRLTIESIGDLQFFYQNSKLLVGLTRRIENFYAFSARKVLELCHYKELPLHPLHAQLQEELLGLFYIFDEEEVTGALLAQTLDTLTEFMDQALA